MSQRKSEPKKSRYYVLPDAATSASKTPIGSASFLPVSIPLLLALVALALASFGGGMLYDHVIPAPQFVSLWSLLAVPMALLFSGVALAASLWPRKTSPHPVNPGSRLVPTLAAGFLLWCILSALRSQTIEASERTLALFAAAFALGVVAAREARSFAGQIVVAGTVAGCASILSGLGINEYLVERRGGNPFWRVFVTFVNPDFLAGFLLLSLPVTLGLFLAMLPRKERSPNLLIGFALVLQFVCLLLTGSRLGLAALLCALVVTGALVIRSGALGGAVRRLVIGATIVLGLVAVVAGGPLYKRLMGSGMESYSAKFRVLTWQGTLRMAKSNPLLGTGLGTFETAYPPYAEVGFTQHAHNGLLQIAGETGFLGAIFLVLTLGGCLLLCVRAVSPGKDRVEESAYPTPMPDMGQPLLAAGIAGALVAALLHNLFDSDIYVPTNTLTLGMVSGLALAMPPLSRSKAEGEIAAGPGKPDTLSLVSRYAGLAIAFLLIVRAGRSGIGRMEAQEGADAQTPVAAAKGYTSALDLDGRNADYLLALASIYERSGQYPEAEQTYKRLLQAAPTGKSYRRYGRFLTALQRKEDAVTQHEKSRQADPNDLQNLLALADAYLAANRSSDAEKVYARMTEMYRGDFGQIRAVPELVDWEYGIAYLGLGDAAAARNDLPGAVKNFTESAHILGDFWNLRHLLIAQIRYQERPDLRQRITESYEQALSRWATALDKMGQPAEATKIRERRADFQAEKEKEDSQSTSSGTP